jgi:cytochrome P450
MTQLFSDEMRRNPYPVYQQLRSASPVFHDPASGLWMIFDYDGVRRALTDVESFSSKYGPDWLIFADPPRHTKLRAIISKAFTPRSIASLEPRIRDLARELLEGAIAGRSAIRAAPTGDSPQIGSANTNERQEFDVATDFAVPLPMMVIAEMIGIPLGDRARFKRWSDVILKMSYTIGRRDEEAAAAANDFMAVTDEMDEYLAKILGARRTNAADPSHADADDDLLSRLIDAEVDGERLSREEILGFFQLLLLAGSETTTNLINNAILCFIEHPEQLARLRGAPELLPAAIEEVLRFRSPLQWVYRLTRRDVELHGQAIPAGRLVLTMIGAANRDVRHFPDPDRFDIARQPNAHLAFGHGMHFCLGAPLGRLEARIALAELLARFDGFELVGDEPWPPRQGLHVLGPTRLPIRVTRTAEQFRAATRRVAAASSRRELSA